MAQQFSIDPAAVHTYSTAAANVRDALVGAAHRTSSAATTADSVLGSDLGALGAEFSAAFVAALGAHADSLHTAAGTVDTHAEVLRTHCAASTETDSGTADAIARAEQVIA